VLLDIVASTAHTDVSMESLQNFHDANQLVFRAGIVCISAETVVMHENKATKRDLPSSDALQVEAKDLKGKIPTPCISMRALKTQP